MRWSDVVWTNVTRVPSHRTDGVVLKVSCPVHVNLLLQSRKLVLILSPASKKIAYFLAHGAMIFL